MQVIGFGFEKINAERKNLKQVPQNISINSNISVKSITQEQVDIVKDKPVLKIDFEFTVDYKPDFAQLIFRGFVVVATEKELAKEVLRRWKNKKLPDEVRLPLFNLILTKCNLKALQLEEELSLPTHIPMPRIKPEENNQNYAG